MSRVVVVGAGMGGLAAGARLAAAGHHVTVLEAGAAIGGKLGWHVETTPVGEFRFDTGPSLLTMPSVFEDLFAATGDPLPEALPVRRLDPAIRHRFADGTEVHTVGDPEDQRARMDAAFGAGAGAAWDRVVDRGARMWAASGHRVIEQPLQLTTLLRSGVRDTLAVAPGTSLRRLGRRLLDDPRQRLMLDRYATYTGSDPRRSPATLATIPYLEQAQGVWYLEGGLHQLSTALADRITARGGVVRTGAAVASVTTAGGRVEGVVLADGTPVQADVVVSDVDAHGLYRRLLPGRGRAPAADSLSGFVLLLAVRGDTPGLAHHNVLFGAADYDDEFDAVFGARARPVEDPVVYVSAPDDPHLAPPGHQAWFVLVNAARHGTDGRPGTLDWNAPGLAASYADTVLSHLAARGLPVRDRLVSTTVRTPADLARLTGAPGGAIYGAASRGLRTTLVRPRNASPVRGLFLVGGSAHPGGGLPLVALSAAITADLVGAA